MYKRSQWHGFPTLRAGSAVSYRLHFVTRGRAPDDHDAPPRAEWMTLAERADHQVTAAVGNPAVGRWTGDRLQGRLDGGQAGASTIAFTLMRGPTTVWPAPPLNFTVRAP